MSVGRDDNKHEHVPTDHVQHVEHHFHTQIATQIENTVDNNTGELQQQCQQKTHWYFIALHIVGDTGLTFGILQSFDLVSSDYELRLVTTNINLTGTALHPKRTTKKLTNSHKNMYWYTSMLMRLPIGRTISFMNSMNDELYFSMLVLKEYVL